MYSCFKNFFYGEKQSYVLPTFNCSEDSSVKSAKELFDRSIKQSYTLILGIIASFLILINKTNSKNNLYKILILIAGLIFLILSEINSEFINLSLSNNIFGVFLPIIFFIFAYILILNLNKKTI